MVIPISYIHCVISVNGNAPGEVQLSITTAMATKLVQELAFWCKDLNTVIVPVSNVEIASAIKCCVCGLVKLSIT